MTNEQTTIILHCGLPKTGTTSLQTWCAANQAALNKGGILYPDDYRDDEGIAHHNLLAISQSSPNKIAENLADISDRGNFSAIFVSSEAFSNILSIKDFDGYNFFATLVESLASRGLSVELLFTVRRIDRYVKSITTQNILYDCLKHKPSLFASHSLTALSRVYSGISRLSRHEYFRLFIHSREVNNRIIEHIQTFAHSNIASSSMAGFHHESPKEHIILFFMWMNNAHIRPSPSLHHFIRNSSMSHQELSQLYNQVVTPLLPDFSSSYYPSLELIHESIGFSKVLWESALSTRQRSEYTNNPVASSALLEFLSRDLKYLIPDYLAEYDLMHKSATSEDNQNLFSAAYDTLCKVAREEAGIDANAA